jgi:hypothetical protein
MAGTKGTKTDIAKSKLTASNRVSGNGLAALHSIARSTTAEHLRAPTTRAAYEGHVKRAKLWLVEEMSHRVNPPGLPEKLGPEELEPWMAPGFALAFEPTPNAASPNALRMYITFKCIEQQCSFSTAEGIHASFKAFWDSVECVTKFSLPM